MQDFIENFENAMKKNQTFVFSSNCEVKYSGRAESHLENGDRLIIIKNDKTLLIHQPHGNNPINYMKFGGTHRIIKEDEEIVLLSEHTKHKEHIRIKLKKIHFFNAHSLTDEAKINLHGSEADMRDMIYENPKIISTDFFPLSREEHTKYGFIDVFGHDKNGGLIIIECKRQTADLKAVTQLRRYIERIAEMKGISNERVKGILASPQITDNALSMLKDWNYEWKMIEPPRKQEGRDKKQKELKEYF